MTWWFPLFLIFAGLLIMWQPRTKRWQRRLGAHLRGDQRRLKQRANTFYLLGFSFCVSGLAILYRVTTGG